MQFRPEKKPILQARLFYCGGEITVNKTVNKNWEQSFISRLESLQRTKPAEIKVSGFIATL